MGRAIRAGAGATVVAAAAVVLAAMPAAAHTEWEPNTAAPGSIIALNLFAEDEQPDASTVSVELQFPQPLTIAELSPGEGMTATPVGGGVGAGTTATGVMWTVAPGSQDLLLPITLGPLPDQEGRLQFKAVQTYDNGEVDRWIGDWPAGAPEPDHPGPVLDLVAGGPGTIPATTALGGCGADDHRGRAVDHRGPQRDSHDRERRHRDRRQRLERAAVRDHRPAGGRRRRGRRRAVPAVAEQAAGRPRSAAATRRAAARGRLTRLGATRRL